jgi:hypothetical protein
MSDTRRRRRYPDNEQRIATRSLRRKWPEAQAEQVASVHVFSSQEGAETIPRDGVVFLWGGRPLRNNSRRLMSNMGRTPPTLMPACQGSGRQVLGADLNYSESGQAARPLCEAASTKSGALDSTASVSAISRRMISAMGRISLIPPAVWPAVSRHSCCRPAWVTRAPSC